MSEIIQPVLFKSPRPTYADERIITYIVDNIFKDFYSWFKSSNINDDISEDLIKEDLLSFFQDNTYQDDGYHLATEFEDFSGNYYYDPDADLVEVLSCVESLRYDGLKELEHLWVKENDMLSPFNIGDKVIDKNKHYKGIGEVKKNDEYGYAYVYFPESGHVKVGSGRHSGILKWEDLELVK